MFGRCFTKPRCKPVSESRSNIVIRVHFRLIPNYPSQWTYKHTFPSCSEGSISDQFSLTFFWSVARKIYKTTSMNDTMSVYLSEVLKVLQYNEPRPTTTLFMRPHSFDLSGDILPFNSDTLKGHLNTIRALRRRGVGTLKRPIVKLYFQVIGTQVTNNENL